MLHFPKLQFLENMIVPRRNKEVAVYQLDWAGFNQLPAPYNAAVDNLLFWINADYLAEIQRNQNRATEEWNLIRNFDTAVRDICLEPAIAHARVAMKLLWDCRAEDQFWVAQNAMVYRMWLGQTGGACVARNAELDKLQALVDNASAPLAELSAIRKFLATISISRRENPEQFKTLGFYESYVSPFTGQKL